MDFFWLIFKVFPSFLSYFNCPVFGFEILFHPPSCLFVFMFDFYDPSPFFVSACRVSQQHAHTHPLRKICLASSPLGIKGVITAVPFLPICWVTRRQPILAHILLMLHTLAAPQWASILLHTGRQEGDEWMRQTGQRKQAMGGEEVVRESKQGREGERWCKSWNVAPPQLSSRVRAHPKYTENSPELPWLEHRWMSAAVYLRWSRCLGLCAGVDDARGSARRCSTVSGFWLKLLLSWAPSFAWLDLFSYGVTTCKEFLSPPQWQLNPAGIIPLRSDYI